MTHITNWNDLLTHIIDSYSKGNRNASIVLDALNEGCGEAFISPLTRVRLTDVTFELQRNAAFVAPGTVEARLYHALGAVGTTAVPNIPAGVLATSDAVAAADINVARGLVNFHFSTPYTLEPEHNYVVVLVLTNCPAGGQVEVGIDAAVPPLHFPTYHGNQTDNITLPPAWTPNPLNDCIFYLWSYSDVLAGGAVDVTDRVARELGKVQLTDYVNDGIVFPHDGSIPTAPAKVEVASFDNLTGISALYDANAPVLSLDHRGSGTHSVEWDKPGGANVASGVQYALPAALDLSVYSTHAAAMWFAYVPTPGAGNITQIYFALGSSIANCWFWAIPVADVHLDEWWHYHHLMSEVSGFIGDGADLSNITWCAMVIVTDAIGSTITDAKVDQLVVKRVWNVVPEVCTGEPLPTEDTGLHTNPERYRHDNHWDNGVELVLNAAAAANLGAVVAAGATRRVRSITVRNTAQTNTVITLSQVAPAQNRVSFDVAPQSTRVWSEQDGIEFLAGVQVQISSSAAAAGEETYIHAAGVEA